MVCGWRGGEAKMIMKGVADSDNGLDGFKAIMIFGKRFDATTAASFLQMYLEVVTPPRSNQYKKWQRGYIKWDIKVFGLTARFIEEVKERLKLVVLMVCCPRNFKT